VLEPTLPRDVLLNSDVPDGAALGMTHVIRGLWLSKVFQLRSWAQVYLYNSSIGT